MVDAAFLLAPGGPVKGSAWPGFYPSGMGGLLSYWHFISMASRYAN